MGCAYDQQRYFYFAFGCRVGVVGDIFYGKDMSYIMLVHSKIPFRFIRFRDFNSAKYMKRR